MDMQREDFLALCKGPKVVFAKFSQAKTPSRIPTHHSMNIANQIRVMEDWFPAGQMFEFLGTICFSKGVEVSKAEGCAPPRASLKVLAPAAAGGLEIVHFGVREALSIAKQISVDTINRLNGVNHRGL